MSKKTVTPKNFPVSAADVAAYKARARRPKTMAELREMADELWTLQTNTAMTVERIIALDEQNRRAAAKRDAAADKRLAKLERTVRGIGKRAGDYMENGGRILEQAVLARLRRRGGVGPVKGKVLGPLKKEGEYDGAVVNGEETVVVEVKRNLRLKDVEEFVARRLPRFAQDFPDLAAGRKLYGALAFQLDADDGKALALAREHGLLLLRVGDKKGLTVLNPDPAEWRALAE